MQSSKSLERLICNLPNDAFLNWFFSAFVFRNKMEDISPLKVLGNNAKSISKFIVEWIFIAENVRMVNAGKNSYLIEAVR